MTKAAQAVLADCRESHGELTDDLSGSVWRRRYFACVALLRAVGHVLHKVDAEVSDQHKSVIASWWQNQKDSRPEPAIFWSFIDDERNRFLKTYGPIAGQNVTVFPGSNRKSETTFVMKDGPFKDVDPRSLITKAIEWWEEELLEINRQIESPTE